MNHFFQFKEFSINQDRAAMKIGTDGVLLGAWASLSHHPNSILDIGSGTGILALMLAQRSTAELIDALELDDNAYEQSVENFENSPWSDRLFCYHADFMKFVEEMKGETYDLILSNPPFFAPPQKETNMTQARQKARFQGSLTYRELISGAAELLSSSGKFSVIIPYESQEDFLTISKNIGLYPQRITNVKGRANSPIKRSLIQVGFENIPIMENQLVIEIERHQYTPEYIALTKEFYLKMK